MTVASCLSEPLLDEWITTGSSPLPAAWVGATYFMTKGKTNIEQIMASGVVQASPSGVNILCTDGQAMLVPPDSLKDVNRKKVLQFDLARSISPQMSLQARGVVILTPPSVSLALGKAANQRCCPPQKPSGRREQVPQTWAHLVRQIDARDDLPGCPDGPAKFDDPRNQAPITVDHGLRQGTLPTGDGEPSDASDGASEDHDGP